MSIEMLEKLREMILEFGAPMNFWTDDERDAFGELENEIAEVRRRSK